MSSAFPSSDGASVDVDARLIHRFRPLVIERSRGILEAFLSPPNAIMITNAHGQMHACPTSGLPGMPCHDVVGDHSGVGEARSGEECIREFYAMGSSSRGAALRVRKIGNMFGSVVTLDKASGAFGKVGIEIYTPFPPPIASLNLPDARTSCFRYRSGCKFLFFRSYCWL
jgi:hypothetical protein